LHDLWAHLIAFAHQIVKEHGLAKCYHGSSVINVRNLFDRKAEFFGGITDDLCLLGASLLNVAPLWQCFKQLASFAFEGLFRLDALFGLLLLHQRLLLGLHPVGLFLP